MAREPGCRFKEHFHGRRKCACGRRLCNHPSPFLFMTISRAMKESVRGLISRLGLAKMFVAVRRARGENVEHLTLSSISDRFAAIYQNRVWLNGRNSGSLSGLGSE